MIQVIKKVNVGGVVHESVITLSESEWALMQKYYSQGNITFEPIPTKKTEIRQTIEPAAKEEEDVDDKTPLADYEYNRVAGVKHLKAKEYDKALRYFEAAYKDKESSWLRGQINKCNKFLEDENNSN